MNDVNYYMMLSSGYTREYINPKTFEIHYINHDDHPPSFVNTTHVDQYFDEFVRNNKIHKMMKFIPSIRTKDPTILVVKEWYDDQKRFMYETIREYDVPKLIIKSVICNTRKI